VDISTTLVAFGQATTVGGRGWIVEFAERWPEVAGMIVGQIVILSSAAGATKSWLERK
jgi:hypothetical protein